MSTAPAVSIAGVHLLPLPTGLPVGDVNAYLIEGDPLTLVDCGPDRASALGALERGMRRLGHRLDDLGLLVISHPHPDHFGLAAELVRRTGVPVACLDIGTPVVEGWDAWAARNDRDVHAGLLRHGVPAAAAAALRDGGHSGRIFAAPVRVDRVLTAGTALDAGGRRFEVLHLPGHSEGDMVLHDRDAGVLIAGDHLLAQISSNALAATPFGAAPGDRPRGRPTPLLDYRASLRRTRELDVAVVLGGHGPPVRDHVALIDERLAAGERRAARLLDLVAGDTLTVHALALRLFGDVAARQVYATASEVLGHLDLLLADGAVTEDRSAEIITFTAIE